MFANLLWKWHRIRKVMKHPLASKCSVDECYFCAILDCPNNADEHYWHDGCPACWGADTNGYRTNYLAKEKKNVQA